MSATPPDDRIPPAEGETPASKGGFSWGLGQSAPANQKPSGDLPGTVEEKTVAGETVPVEPNPRSTGQSAPQPEPIVPVAPLEEPTVGPATEVFAAASDIPPSAIDHLFGDTQFREYEGDGIIGPIPSVLAAAAAPVVEPREPRAPREPRVREPRGPREPSGPMSKNQRALLWVVGSLLAVFALVILFFIGTKIASLNEAKPTAAVKPSATSSPSVAPSVKPVAPAAVGDHKWDALGGGECLNPFTSPWAETFTVVDCASPHAAQLVFRGTFPATATAPTAPAASASPSAAPATDPYPGANALQTQINLLCTAPGVINLATAGAYSDIQFQGTYPATEKQWASEPHDYYCFVSRSSGQPISGSVATPAG